MRVHTKEFPPLDAAAWQAAYRQRGWGVTPLDPAAQTRRSVALITFPPDPRYAPLRGPGSATPVPGTVRALVYLLCDAAAPEAAAVLACGPGPVLARAPLNLVTRHKSQLVFEGLVLAEDVPETCDPRDVRLRVEVSGLERDAAAAAPDVSSWQAAQLERGAGGWAVVLPAAPVHLRTTWLESFTLSVDFTALINW